MSDRFPVRVQLFGKHREIVGSAVVELELEAGGTVADLRGLLAAHPVLGRWLGGSAIAVNRRYGRDESVVAAGDEVAIIPPVAGG